MTKLEQDLRKMAKIARINNQAIYCHYQNLWWTPKEFEKALDDGKFHWGTENFQFRSLEDRTRQLRRARDEAQRELMEWLERINTTGYKLDEIMRNEG